MTVAMTATLSWCQEHKLILSQAKTSRIIFIYRQIYNVFVINATAGREVSLFLPLIHFSPSNLLFVFYLLSPLDTCLTFFLHCEAIVATTLISGGV